ncbi:N-acetylmuramoyl-L-alanine amidase family protein [Nocardioides aromaticivorans]|uniref:N-acetylmuramoyl-L-alanine amidase family protein n=1 Tax=Nocardioides aromaticivorans TaxID=200618 RepID=UPI001F5E111C|nr:N-acetylmuramoyl-L-alanine amidase [Nocardioides aromaticivorans]
MIRTRGSGRAAALLLVAALAAGCATEAPPADPGTTPSASPGAGSTAPSPSGSGEGRDRRLAGKVVVLDPGHQLGNRHHAAEIAESVDAGGFEKECNTTGTATDDGYPEATFTWQVAVVARHLLEQRGARVVLTRDADSDDEWGPCVDERGRIGNPGEPGPTADVRVSIHADGVLDESATGFHVIRPALRAGWTDDIERPSRRLARALRDALVAEGIGVSSYRGERGIDVRDDLGTLNLSDVPAVMAELGNMRAAGDAELMESDAGRRRYGRAIADAVTAYLGR